MDAPGRAPGPVASIRQSTSVLASSLARRARAAGDQKGRGSGFPAELLLALDPLRLQAYRTRTCTIGDGGERCLRLVARTDRCSKQALGSLQAALRQQGNSRCREQFALATAPAKPTDYVTHNHLSTASTAAPQVSSRIASIGNLGNSALDPELRFTWLQQQREVQENNTADRPLRRGSRQHKLCTSTDTLARAGMVPFVQAGRYSPEGGVIFSNDGNPPGLLHYFGGHSRWSDWKQGPRVAGGTSVRVLSQCPTLQTETEAPG